LQELKAARKTLNDSLQKLYTDPNAGLLGEKAKKYFEIMNYVQIDVGEQIAEIKRAAREAQKSYESDIENMKSIAELATHIPDSPVDEKIVKDLQTWNEIKWDHFDPVLFSIMKLDLHKAKGGLKYKKREKHELVKLVSRTDDLLKLSDVPPPKLELSLEFIVANVHTCQYFKRFLRSQFCEENIQFYFENEKYKKIMDINVRKQRAQEIIQQYVKDGAERQIHVSDTDKKYILSKCDEAPLDLFQAASTVAYKLMKSNFTNFEESDLYQKMKSRLKGLCSIEDYATLSPEAIRKMNTPRKAKIKTKDDIRANLATKPKSLLSNKLGLSVEYLTVFPTLLKVSTVSQLPRMGGTISVFVGLSDGSIQLYTVEKSEYKLTTTLQHKQQITAIVHIDYFVELHLMACLDESGQIHLWNYEKLKYLSPLGTPEDNFSSFIKMDSFTLWAACTLEPKVKVWNMKLVKKTSKKAEKEINVERPVTCFTRNITDVWMGHYDGSISRYNSNTMKKIDTLPREHTKAVITLLKNEVRSVSETFISSTVSMWSASKDGSVCVWTEDGEKKMFHQKPTTLPVTSFAYIDNFVISGSEDATITIWNRKTSEVVEELPVIHKDLISGMQIIDGQMLWVGSHDRSISIWKLSF
jgi:WD40 repeat protein